MTDTSKFVPTPLADAVAPARRRHRELLDAARGWQIGRERQTDPDLFALICAAVDDRRPFRDDDSDDRRVTPVRWTRTGTYGAVRCRILNWCSTQRCRWPDHLPEAMWAWFDFLHETGRMHPDSDPVAELRKPLACYGWLDQDGRRLPPDAPRQIECECFLPYRETVELLGELVRQSEYTGRDPLDALRLAAGRPVEPPLWNPEDRPYAGPILGDDGDRLDGYGSVGLLDDPWADPAPGD